MQTGKKPDRFSHVEAENGEISKRIARISSIDALIALCGRRLGAVVYTANEEDFALDVLTKGVFLGIKHAARAMKKQGHGGAIINTASTAGLSGGSGPLVYSAAKAAVINLTKSSAVQLAPDRIRVNAICPGAILTGLTDQGDPQAAAQALAGFQPWPEHGKGENIAGAALFLASQDAAFVTGEALVVDGGLTAVGPDMWRRFSLKQEAQAHNSQVNRGSTGEAVTSRRVKEL